MYFPPFADCQLQKHNLIKHLKKELAEAKKGEGSNANTATVNSDVTFERNVSLLW